MDNCRDCAHFRQKSVDGESIRWCYVFDVEIGKDALDGPCKFKVRRASE